MEGIEGVGGALPAGGGLVAPGTRMLLRGAGGEPGLELGQGQVRGDLPAGDVELLALGVEVAGPPDRVALQVTRGQAADLHRDAVGLKVGEEFPDVRGVGDGITDAVLQPGAAGLLPAQALGLVHLGLARAALAGAVAGLDLVEAEFLLDGAGLGLGALAAVVELGVAAVLADGGGEDMDVIVGVPHRDPPAGERVAVGCDAGSVDDPARDLAPLGVGEVPVAGCGADGAVPDVVGDLLAEAAVAQVHRLVEDPGELGEGGVLVAAGITEAERAERGDDVRIEVLVVAAGPVQVGEQTAGLAAGGLDRGDHARTPPSGSMGISRALAMRVSSRSSRSRRSRMSGSIRSSRCSTWVSWLMLTPMRSMLKRTLARNSWSARRSVCRGRSTVNLPRMNASVMSPRYPETVSR